ncbi:MAG: hypothetical protein ICV66_07270 [Chitinophagaceae bacterium]|nr:hypothetical protein [Chitinophagaceae bacterium]
MPENILNGIGQFNVFKFDPFVGGNAKSVPYRHRDYYKISLVIGNSKLHYADKLIEVQKQALVFFNPQITCKWEHTDTIWSGFFCVFHRNFFRQYENVNHYAVFQPSGTPVFELSDEQVNKVQSIFERMFEEINSDYIHKYHVLRMLVFELIHFALKMEPSAKFDAQPINGS